MERLLANVMVWHFYDEWEDRYVAAVEEEFEGQEALDALQYDIVADVDSEVDTWGHYKLFVLPIFEIYDANLFKRELVAALETVYRDENVSLEEFNGIAFNISQVLDDYHIDDDDILEFSYGILFTDEGHPEQSRACYEDVFARYKVVSKTRHV